MAIMLNFIFSLICGMYLSSLAFAQKSQSELKKVSKPQNATKKFSASKFFKVGFYTFQNQTKIKTPDSEYIGLDYTTTGLIFGYDESINNGRLKLGTTLNFFYGNTDARSDSNDLYYFKKELPTYGAMAGLSALFSANRMGQYFLGPEVNIYYLRTKWSIPKSNGVSWTIQKTDKAQFSLLLNGEYFYKELMFYHKFGYPLGGKSFIWNIGVGYQL